MRAWGSGYEKEENGPSGADPLGPALCLCWLVTSLPFLLLRYSFQDYLQPWPQCSCKLQILFSLFFSLSHSLPSFLVRGAVLYMALFVETSTLIHWFPSMKGE